LQAKSFTKKHYLLKASRHVDAVLVVDDGSTDDTKEVAQEAGALVVSHEINKGYGAAFRSCFEYAKEHNVDIMVILDGDGQHDPKVTPEEGIRRTVEWMKSVY
jgi:glycosyltransferase involved in cell wall biosynthesis